MARVGLRLGPFYVSSGGGRRRRRGPTAAQRHAQAVAAAQRRTQVAHQRAQRRATYGSYRFADVRTWFSWQWLLAILALGVIVVLPVSLGDGPAAETVWLVAVGLGVLAWGTRVAQLSAAQAPARRAAAEHAARTEQAAQAEAARRAAEQAAYLAPRQVGNAWRHGQCTVNHRTLDAAQRCRRG